MATGHPDTQLDIARDNLLGRLKSRYNTGASRPSLYNIPGKKPPHTRIELRWRSYAGNGDYTLSDCFAGRDREAAESLIEDGLLVPTLEEDYYGATIQRLTPFDDIQWAQDADKNFIILELRHFEGLKDLVIRPDQRHDAAIGVLKKRMQMHVISNSAWVSAPINLNDGTEVSPILTNKDAIILQMRRQGIEP